MAEITKLQIKILEDLYRRDIESEEVILTAGKYVLVEKDPIMKIRELVYNIEKMDALNYVDLDLNYFVESDFVSFEYMNSAVELEEKRIRISSLGIAYIEARRQTRLKKVYNFMKNWFNRQFVDRPYKLALTHIISFILGALVMWGITQLF